jgi:ABC-type polysaccharide/polyol phosphate export permease
MKFFSELFSDSGLTSSRRFLLYIFSGVYIWYFIHKTIKGTLTQSTEDQFAQITIFLIAAVLFDKLPAIISAFRGNATAAAEAAPGGGGDRPNTPPKLP